MFKLLGNPMLDEMLGGDPEASQPDPRVPIDDKPWQERMEAGEIPVVYGPREGTRGPFPSPNFSTNPGHPASFFIR